MEYAKVFNLLFHEDINKIDKKMRDSVSEFRKVNSDIPLSIVMEFYYLYRKGKIDSTTMGELIASINTYMIRRSLCDINSQNISRLFPTVLKNVIDKCNENGLKRLYSFWNLTSFWGMVSVNIVGRWLSPALQ